MTSFPQSSSFVLSKKKKLNPLYSNRQLPPIPFQPINGSNSLIEKEIPPSPTLSRSSSVAADSNSPLIRTPPPIPGPKNSQQRPLGLAHDHFVQIAELSLVASRDAPWLRSILDNPMMCNPSLASSPQPFPSPPCPVFVTLRYGAFSASTRRARLEPMVLTKLEKETEKQVDGRRIQLVWQPKVEPLVAVAAEPGREVSWRIPISEDRGESPTTTMAANDQEGNEKTTLQIEIRADRAILPSRRIATAELPFDTLSSVHGSLPKTVWVSLSPGVELAITVLHCSRLGVSANKHRNSIV